MQYKTIRKLFVNINYTNKLTINKINYILDGKCYFDNT